MTFEESQYFKMNYYEKINVLVTCMFICLNHKKKQNMKKKIEKKQKITFLIFKRRETISSFTFKSVF